MSGYSRGLPVAEILYEAPDFGPRPWWVDNWPLVRVAVWLGTTALMYAIL